MVLLLWTLWVAGAAEPLDGPAAQLARRLEASPSVSRGCPRTRWPHRCPADRAWTRLERLDHDQLAAMLGHPSAVVRTYAAAELIGRGHLPDDPVLAPIREDHRSVRSNRGCVRGERGSIVHIAEQLSSRSDRWLHVDDLLLEGAAARAARSLDGLSRVHGGSCARGVCHLRIWRGVRALDVSALAQLAQHPSPVVRAYAGAVLLARGHDLEDPLLAPVRDDERVVAGPGEILASGTVSELAAALAAARPWTGRHQRPHEVWR